MWQNGDHGKGFLKQFHSDGYITPEICNKPGKLHANGD